MRLDTLTRAVFAAVFACFSTVAHAGDPSIAVLSSGRGGAARLLLDSGTTLSSVNPSDFRVLVGNGGAQVVKVTPFGAKPVYTALAFDASGSFAPNLPASVQLARDFVHGLPADGQHTTAVFTFGSGLTELGEGKSEGEVSALLDRVAAERAQNITRLKAFLIDTIALVGARPASSNDALRQVVVFTDAGDESPIFTMKQVVADARKRGVRVHVVEFSRLAASRAKNQPAQTLAATVLDETKNLAASTGGAHLDGASGGTPSGLLDVGRSTGRMYWLDLTFCGVTSTEPFIDDSLSVELTATGAATEKANFSQEISGVAVTACPAAVAVGTSGAGVTPSAGSTAPVASPSGNVSPSTGTWPWWLLGAVAVLAGTGVVVLAAIAGARALASRAPGEGPGAVRKPPPPPTSSPLAAARSAHDEVDPEPPVVTGVPPGILSDLPETHLQVLRGPPDILGKGYFRINRHLMVVGGFKEDGVDLVVAVQEISTRHVQFQLYPNGTLWIEDLGSRNGTFVNDRRLAKGERVSLVANDRIMLSQQVELRVHQPGRASHTPVAAPSATAKPVAVPPAPPKPGIKTTYAPVGSASSSEPQPTPATESPPSAMPAPPAPPTRAKQKTMYAPVKPPGEES